MYPNTSHWWRRGAAGSVVTSKTDQGENAFLFNPAQGLNSVLKTVVDAPVRCY